MIVDDSLRTYEMLSAKQRIYVDWVAGGGTIVTEDGQISTLTSQALADSLGVSRQAIHKYRKLKGFWDIVADRRRELYGQDRMSLLYKAVWAKGLKGDTAAAKLMMQQARVLEAERSQVDVTGAIGVAVINYGDKGSVSHNVIEAQGEKNVAAPGEKPQIGEVPVPDIYTQHPQPESPDTAKAAKVLKPRKKSGPSRSQ